MSEINLGDRAKDSITGWSGVVVAITEWLHGCRRIAIQPEKLNKDGEPFEHKSFDEPQVELVEAEAAAVGSRKTGGPRPEPQRGR